MMDEFLFIVCVASDCDVSDGTNKETSETKIVPSLAQVIHTHKRTQELCSKNIFGLID